MNSWLDVSRADCMRHTRAAITPNHDERKKKPRIGLDVGLRGPQGTVEKEKLGSTLTFFRRNKTLSWS